MAPLFEAGQNQVNVRKPHAKHAFTSVLRAAYTALARAGHAASVRKIALLLALLAALATAGAAGGGPPRRHPPGGQRGPPPPQLIQELDGSRARIVVTPRTVIVLDGRPATLSELRRGDVVFVVHVGRRPARQIRAFSR